MNECAYRFVTADVWRMLRWVERANQHGILPAGPAGLKNTKAFLDAWDYIETEQHEMRDRLKPRK